nr:hypothetical protein [uncultured Kingella sp.]
MLLSACSGVIASSYNNRQSQSDYGNGIVNICKIGRNHLYAAQGFQAAFEPYRQPENHLAQFSIAQSF